MPRSPFPLGRAARGILKMRKAASSRDSFQADPCPPARSPPTGRAPDRKRPRARRSARRERGRKRRPFEAQNPTVSAESGGSPTKGRACSPETRAPGGKSAPARLPVPGRPPPVGQLQLSAILLSFREYQPERGWAASGPRPVSACASPGRCPCPSAVRSPAPPPLESR